MSALKYLVIHCTDTPVGREVSAEEIEKWHIKENGWSRVGYSDMIHLDGSLENLIEFDQDDVVDPWEVSNGARGVNFCSRHIVYVGGANGEDTRTWDQIAALGIYVNYMVLRHPNIKICGHNQVSKKECPGFDVSLWLDAICIEEKNIMR